MSAEAVTEFLRAHGAAELPHAHGRSLLEHLLGTATILSRWGAPEALQAAALLHSVYGTDAYRHQLLERARRDDVRAVAGEEAERLAHLFAMTPRAPLFAGTHRWARSDVVTRAELDALVLLHMANLAEQARSPDGSPGRW